MLLCRLLGKLDQCSAVSFTEPGAGVEGINYAENVPDLVLVDYMMPGMNGLSSSGFRKISSLR